MSGELRDRLAAALAETFTSPHGARNPDWDWEKPDGPDNPYHLPVELAERMEQSPHVVFTAGDGCTSVRMPSCMELADALLSGPLAPLLAALAAVERVEAVCEALSESAAEAEADACRAVIDARKVLAALGEALDGPT